MSLSPADLFVTILIILGVPLALGMITEAKFPRIAQDPKTDQNGAHGFCDLHCWRNRGKLARVFRKRRLGCCHRRAS
ncbi:MAG: hypothetical protein R3A47_05465 [Polyangiales bacterium]